MRRIALISFLFLLLATPIFADTTVTFIDVGQGDAIWVHDDTGHDVLIDAGEAQWGDVVLQHLEDVPDLDVVIWTHAHADHIGGLLDVIEAKPVDQILYNGFDYNSVTYNDLWDLIIAYNIPQASTHRGDTYIWGECTATVLHPDREYLNTNNSSVVVKLSCGEVDFLLTGDAEWEAESSMLDAGLALDSEILKVGHHGSNTSSSSVFLDAVDPDIAVISVGDNTYGHPSQVTLDRLASRGIRTFRTDQDGTVSIRTNGTSYWVVGEEAMAWLYLPLVLRAPGTPIPTPTFTPTATLPASATSFPTWTPTPTMTPTRTATWTPTVQPTVTWTPTPTTGPTTNTLRITALSYDGRDEYVQIHNDGPNVQNMSGWKIHSVTGDQWYSFPNGYVLAAGADVRVHSGPDAVDNPPTDLRWTGSYIWNNDGDEARLINAEGVEVDRWGY